MADIFVSYRREDSPWPAGRINERLEAVFGAGRVFFDTVTIRPGDDFHEVLGTRVGACKVLLAVIGPRWLEILEARLGEANDFVRIEIAEALERKVRVIPVRIDGAKPPPAARLPDDLKPLARLNAVLVRADTFRSDLDHLIEFLKDFLEGPASTHVTPPATHVTPPTDPGEPIAVTIGAADRSVRYFVPGAGETEWFKDIDVGPEMVVVPAGSFMMGSPETEPEREQVYKGSESPLRSVTIAQPFAIARHAVTRRQFAAFINDTGYAVQDGAAVLNGDTMKEEHDPKASWRAPGFAQDDNHPVVCVSWHDARAYISWLSDVTRKAYRLPSEAEWEYGCRARNATPFWWGASITTNQANYHGKTYYAGGDRGELRNRTVPVESFEPNPWGLYQVHGNVWEWCQDAWHDTYHSAPTDGRPWLRDGEEGLSVLRGGSWFFYPACLRSAARYRINSGYRINDVGFRVARTVDY